MKKTGLTAANKDGGAPPETPGGDRGGTKWWRDGALGRALGWVNGPSRAATFAVLLVVAVLLGRDIISSLGVASEIRELKRQKKELEESIAADSTLLRRLDDPEFLERYAREHYLMRREGETVYVVTE